MENVLYSEQYNNNTQDDPNFEIFQQSINRIKQKTRVSFRLKQNKYQKMLLEIQRQKQNQKILQNRKEKQKKIYQKIKQNQQILKHKNYQTEKIFKNIRDIQLEEIQEKNKLIEQKIYQKRLKVEKVRTVYSHKIHNKIKQDQQKNRKRLQQIEKSIFEKSLNIHMKQWQQYQKKVKEKHNLSLKTAKNINLYDRYANKSVEINNLVERYKQKQYKTTLNINDINKQEIHKKDERIKKIKKISVKKVDTINSFTICQSTYFGLTKIFKNPANYFKAIQDYLIQTTTSKNIQDDSTLINKLEQFLQKI